MGPKTSRAWKCGNRSKPKRVGSVVVLVNSGWTGAERMEGTAAKNGSKEDEYMMEMMVLDFACR